MTKDFCYVYIVFRPNGIPCYVGKGTGDRFKRHNRKNAHLRNIANAADGELPVVIIRDGLNNSDAYDLEKELIEIIGREPCGPLVNKSDGGKGGSTGSKISAEWKKNRSRKARLLWQDKEYREHMLRPDRGRSGNKNPRSETFKQNMSERLKGNTNTLGLKHSEEARTKMSISRKGLSKSLAHRAAIAAAVKSAHAKRFAETGNASFKRVD